MRDQSWWLDVVLRPVLVEEPFGQRGVSIEEIRAFTGLTFAEAKGLAARLYDEGVPELSTDDVDDPILLGLVAVQLLDGPETPSEVRAALQFVLELALLRSATEGSVERQRVVRQTAVLYAGVCSVTPEARRAIELLNRAGVYGEAAQGELVSWGWTPGGIRIELSGGQD